MNNEKLTQSEINEKLSVKITKRQLYELNTIYEVLDFNKDIFFKLLNAIGIDSWLTNIARFEYLLMSFEYLEASVKRINKFKLIRKRLRIPLIIIFSLIAVFIVSILIQLKE